MSTLPNRMKAVPMPNMKRFIELIEDHRDKYRTNGIFHVNKMFTLDELFINHFNNSHWDNVINKGWSCKIMEEIDVMANNVYASTHRAISYETYVKTLLLKMDIDCTVIITNVDDYNLEDYITKIGPNQYHQSLLVNNNIK